MDRPSRILDALYPTHLDYVSKVQQATEANVAAGFLLKADMQRIVNEAHLALVGK
jgi:hypothetical protein